MVATTDLFATFDPLAGLDDPVADSLFLVSKIVEKDGSVDVRALHQETGWSLRRFNPALSLVIAEIDERRVSKTLGSEYSARHFIVTAEDRVALKRYAANRSG